MSGQGMREEMDREQMNIEMLEEIQEAAEDLQIPDGLTPEKMMEKLSELNIAEAAAFRAEKKRRSRRFFYSAYAVCAAAMLAMCSYALFRTVGTGYNTVGLKQADKGSLVAANDQNDEAKEGQAGVMADTQSGAVVGGQSGSEEVNKPAKQEQREDAGELYVVATDYGQVYDIIMNSDYRYTGAIMIDGVVAEAVVVEEAVEAESSGSSQIRDFAGAPTDSIGAVMNDVAKKTSTGETSGKEFATTNLQTQGVDESDIVKTDGDYLYIVRNNRITIVDVRNGEPKEAGRLEVATDSGFGDILEIYVDNDKLIAVVQETSTQLQSVGETQKMEATESARTPLKGWSVSTGKQQYRTVTATSTALYTYSLADPSQPKLLGSVSQDGYYHTSRKIRDKVYLFTNEWISESCYGSSRDSQDWIPLAGGTPIAADCIYVPQTGGKSLVISSVDVDNPKEIYDTVMIVNDSVEVYVSTDAIYLYNTRYSYNGNTSYNLSSSFSGNKVRTEIAKFSLNDGYINAVGATSVNGSVSDTFAVNASQGMLRILTNDSNEEGSCLYILDEKLSLLGKLEGIAPGEQIYAARYLGDMAYFVTYRNMDPLFAADLSDPANPKILGELKITGYSDYLHMWKDGTMYGIGYETDPDTGVRKGVKLAMFDVSDPVNLSVLDSVCIINADYSPAMSQYKTILTDVNNNLIGFAVTEYQKGESNTYLLFQWRDGAFENILTVEIGRGADLVRGVYAGEYFYIVTMDEVIGYSRTDGFAELGKLSLGE